YIIVPDLFFSTLKGFTDEIMRTRKKHPNIGTIHIITERIETHLSRLGLALAIVLLVLQVYHYYSAFYGAHNPLYSMGSGVGPISRSEYQQVLIHIETAIGEGDEVLIRVNGRIIDSVQNQHPLFVNLLSKDMLEIDAREIRTPGQIVINSEPTQTHPEGYTQKLNIDGELYRLSPIK
ncbi:MAG TPA: hypothetical protein VFD89_01550, partial [Clostridia bacterium]|nr:hypothetical protein [Clostridia bacterium]